MLTWTLLLLCASLIEADLLVRTVTINNVNYDDFSLLCAEGIPLLMEDHKPRPCQPRPWKAEQKCPAGFWCHEGDDESSYYCCPRSRKVANHCHLPPATGFGKQLMRRFYYDWKTDGCHELHYTGIGGNENSYMTYETCEAEWAGEPTPKVFGGLSSNTKEDKKNPEKEKISKNKGPTISFTISSTEKPEVLPSSERTVEIPLLPSTTQSRKTSSLTISITPLPITATTTSPTTVGITSSPLPNVANPCTLPPERGTSGGIARKMWYFDMSTLGCVQFTYQGNGGNANKFDNSQTCMTTCGIGKPTRKSCDLPPTIGDGPFKIPRFYFDSKSQRCEMFYYSGQNGNDNRFYKKHKCERLCLGKQSKKKEQTRMPDPVTMSPTRFIDSFVSSEPTNRPTDTPAPFEYYTQRTTPSTMRANEIEIPTEITRRPDDLKPEPMHFEKLETKQTPYVVEQLPETTIVPSETSSLFFTPPPSTSSPFGFIHTETQRPVEPQTFPTLVYVPREESIPPYIYPEPPPKTQKPIDEMFNQLMTAQFPSITQAPPQRPLQPITATVAQQPKETILPQQPQPQRPSLQPQQTQQPYLQPQPPQQPFVQPQHPQEPFVQPQHPPVVMQTAPQHPIYATGSPTIIETSQVGPAPDNHLPLGNFPWETTPPGYTMPPNVPRVYVPTPEQLEAMVNAMGVNPNHQIHGGSVPQQPPVQPTLQQSIVISQGVKPAEAPAGSLLSTPQPLRQWGTSQPPPTESSPVVSDIQPLESQVQPQPSYLVPRTNVQHPQQLQVVLPALQPSVPVSSGNQVVPLESKIGVQPTSPPFVSVPPFVPTQAPQLPSILPSSSSNQGPLGSFQPHPSNFVVEQPTGKIMVNPVPTETFTVNLTKSHIPGLTVEIATQEPVIEFYPNINVSIVSELNSPCQLPVTDPDVVIMCEVQDINCPSGSFCQIGLGQSICCPAPGGNPCYQPMQEGVGVAQLIRWYYNPTTKHCETFSFKGFQGNENNFVMYSECQNTCGAENPCERGQPVPATNPEQKCSSANRCPPDSMCHSVGSSSACCNPSTPVAAPQKPKVDNDPCRQPIAEGSGGGAHHRWAFDQNAGRCVSFIFQGDNGNLNNFLTKSDCQAICGAPPTVPSRCLQPGLSGDGDEYLARYFYSPEYRQCLHFIYSGKGGNENNFETQQDCLETCIANGIKFSSLASIVSQPTFSFSFMPAPVCPQGSPILGANDEPLGCSVTPCPNGHVCTTMGTSQYCCPAPENFCLEPRPPVSVCSKGGTPVAQIRFTYDPLSDKCVRFSYEDCNPSVTSLNNFSSQPQCSRLCCNQGFNLLYRRKLRLMLNDEPLEDFKRTKRI